MPIRNLIVCLSGPRYRSGVRRKLRRILPAANSRPARYSQCDTGSGQISCDGALRRLGNFHGRHDQDLNSGVRPHKPVDPERSNSSAYAFWQARRGGLQFLLQPRRVCARRAHTAKQRRLELSSVAYRNRCRSPGYSGADLHVYGDDSSGSRVDRGWEFARKCGRRLSNGRRGPGPRGQNCPIMQHARTPSSWE